MLPRSRRTAARRPGEPPGARPVGGCPASVSRRVMSRTVRVIAHPIRCHCHGQSAAREASSASVRESACAVPARRCSGSRPQSLDRPGLARVARVPDRGRGRPGRARRVAAPARLPPHAGPLWGRLAPGLKVFAVLRALRSPVAACRAASPRSHDPARDARRDSAAHAARSSRRHRLPDCDGAPGAPGRTCRWCC